MASVWIGDRPAGAERAAGEHPTEQRVRQGQRPKKRADPDVPIGPRGDNRGRDKQRTERESADAHQRPGWSGARDGDQRTGIERNPGDDRRDSAGTRIPPAAPSTGADGNRLDRVVVVKLRPVLIGEPEAQHVAVPDALVDQTLAGVERTTGHAPQHPSGMQRAAIGQLLAAGRKECRQQRRHRDALGQRDVDASVRRLHTDADEIGPGGCHRTYLSRPGDGGKPVPPLIHNGQWGYATGRPSA